MPAHTARIALSLTALCVPGLLVAQVRPEIYPLETSTLTTQQILTGQKSGKPTRLAGELRLPPGSGRIPAVVLVHGSGGMSVGTERWAQELNNIGVQNGYIK